MNHKEETQKVKEVLRQHGYMAKVWHGTGTTYGWIYCKITGNMPTGTAIIVENIIADVIGQPKYPADHNGISVYVRQD